jgi:hypothetical protein
VSAVAHRVADDDARSVPRFADPADRADAARLLWVALQLRDEWPAQAVWPAVPSEIDDPMAAVAWTYGLTADQYSQLVRRT